MTRKAIAALICISVTLVLQFQPAYSESTSEPIVGETILSAEGVVITTTGYRATKLLGAAVYNSKAQKIGVLEDFIVTAADEVTVAIVTVGGFLGVGGRRVAIPTELFETNDLHQIIFPNGTKEELMRLPAFNYANTGKR